MQLEEYPLFWQISTGIKRMSKQISQRSEILTGFTKMSDFDRYHKNVKH